ncbi:MAG: nucleotidyltransferase family protein [Gammaproteobacteria bacterium]|nr:nucleotidyltransferase family protein [Gammaproteobacteria bacterium]
MKAMILAAGRGERMRPLTDERPKPLLDVGGRSLLEWHLAALARAGIRDVVINHAWLGERIVEALGDGHRHGVRLQYSAESEGALETAGGIIQALPMLGSDPFLVINGDIWTDFDFSRHTALDEQALGSLVLVPNPSQHPRGDFSLIARDGSGFDILADPPRLEAEDAPPRYTFSGIAVYRPEFFTGFPPGRRPLLPLLRAAAASGRLRGRLYQGLWFDIGTSERLRELDERLASGATG